MSKITAVGKSETAVMEPRMDGSYVERSYIGNLFRCEDCGRTWDKRWYAESCESRNHADSFQQGPYGVTHVLNGVPQGNIRWYTRQCVRRDPV